MYLNELSVLMVADAASPFHRRLEAVERDVHALFALHSMDVVAQAVENAQSTLGEQKQYLDEAMAKETRLLKEAVENAQSTLGEQKQYLDEAMAKETRLLKEVERATIAGE
ncbi:uncharacterized protein A4U43_C09F10950 [Asparagus officinalis]|uniref:RING-type E3 ubiquitin transferase n=1 Tax=Asparagus officinalis TaxID=4686 RepID=A0A5P1EBM8_ASPOF|nr:uncharacterized protein A4U43_C09F10950 [Asparagus officinalis]